jgi:hypothetical protein
LKCFPIIELCIFNEPVGVAVVLPHPSGAGSATATPTTEDHSPSEDQKGNVRRRCEPQSHVGQLLGGSNEKNNNDQIEKTLFETRSLENGEREVMPHGQTPTIADKKNAPHHVRTKNFGRSIKFGRYRCLVNGS